MISFWGHKFTAANEEVYSLSAKKKKHLYINNEEVCEFREGGPNGKLCWEKPIDINITLPTITEYGDKCYAYLYHMGSEYGKRFTTLYDTSDGWSDTNSWNKAKTWKINEIDNTDKILLDNTQTLTVEAWYSSKIRILLVDDRGSHPSYTNSGNCLGWDYTVATSEYLTVYNFLSGTYNDLATGQDRTKNSRCILVDIDCNKLPLKETKLNIDLNLFKSNQKYYTLTTNLPKDRYIIEKFYSDLALTNEITEAVPGQTVWTKFSLDNPSMPNNSYRPYYFLYRPEEEWESDGADDYLLEQTFWKMEDGREDKAIVVSQEFIVPSEEGSTTTLSNKDYGPTVELNSTTCTLSYHDHENHTVPKHWFYACYFEDQAYYRRALNLTVNPPMLYNFYSGGENAIQNLLSSSTRYDFTVKDGYEFFNKIPGDTLTVTGSIDNLRYSGNKVFNCTFDIAKHELYISLNGISVRSDPEADIIVPELTGVEWGFHAWLAPDGINLKRSYDQQYYFGNVELRTDILSDYSEAIHIVATSNSIATTGGNRMYWTNFSKPTKFYQILKDKRTAQHLIYKYAAKCFEIPEGTIRQDYYLPRGRNAKLYNPSCDGYIWIPYYHISNGSQSITNLEIIINDTISSTSKIYVLEIGDSFGPESLYYFNFIDDVTQRDSGYRDDDDNIIYETNSAYQVLQRLEYVDDNNRVCGPISIENGQKFNQLSPYLGSNARLSYGSWQTLSVTNWYSGLASYMTNEAVMAKLRSSQDGYSYIYDMQLHFPIRYK